jgi:NAD+ diphosphatase
MNFIPLFTEPFQQRGPAFWFLFLGQNLLVDPSDGIPMVPYVTDLARLNLKPERKQYLGALNGRSCYSAELPSDGAEPPEGMLFQGLRTLFSTMNETFYKIAGLGLQIVNWDQTHQYCGRCGTPTEDKDDERAKRCPKCDLISYPRISPAIIVAVVKDHHILLARANRSPVKKIFYSVIAGYMEAGETLEECVKREVWEEVGIEVKNIRYFGSQSWPFSSSLMVAFTAEYAGGEIKVDNTEILHADWFTADNLCTGQKCFRSLKTGPDRCSVIPGGNAGNRRDSRHFRPGIQFLSCTQLIMSAVTVAILARILGSEATVRVTDGGAVSNAVPFMLTLKIWCVEMLLLSVKIFVIIMVLMVILELMKQFDIIRHIVSPLTPVLKIMGLNQRVGMLWLTANIFGISYGAAVIVEEVKEGNLTHEELTKLHLSIGINHAMIEDPALFLPLGISPFWLWVPRLIMAIAAVHLFALWRWITLGTYRSDGKRREFSPDPCHSGQK